MPKLSNAQAKILRTIIARGGEMNGYAGQPGFYCNSVRPLTRMGLLEYVKPCDGCRGRDWDKQVCERPLIGQSGGQRCYIRVRITAAGRSAVDEQAGLHGVIRPGKAPALAAASVEKIKTARTRKPSPAQCRALRYLRDCTHAGRMQTWDAAYAEDDHVAPPATWRACIKYGWVEVVDAFHDWAGGSFQITAAGRDAIKDWPA